MERRSQTTKHIVSATLAILCLVSCSSGTCVSPQAPETSVPEDGGASYARSLPDTTDGIFVFMDQLAIGSDAQVRFIAESYVGSQKMTDRETEQIRRYNPGFVVLQYRLAYGLSTADNIVGPDTWDRDTIEPDGADDPRRTSEEFYLHHPAGSTSRVIHADHYFLADVRNERWQTYQIEELLRRMPTNDFDGAFLDTAHIRIDRFEPYEWYESFCEPDVTALSGCWTPPARSYFERLVRRFREGDRAYYAIGNFGALITGWDRAEYLAPLDGGVVEMFMGSEAPLNEGDWHIAAERIVRLIGNDKIFIAEPLGYDLGDIPTRKWLIANFLLFKGRRSFVAFYPRGFEFGEADPFWFPEYEIDLGRPVDPVPTRHEAFCSGESDGRSCSGVQARFFEHGATLVNPSGSRRELTLPAPPAGLRYAEVDFSGGGRVDGQGTKAQQSLTYRALEGFVATIAASSGMVLVHVDDSGRPAQGGR